MVSKKTLTAESLEALTPVARTDDYPDVFVVDADGRRIAWAAVSRIDENEMQATIERWMGAAMKLGETEINLKMIAICAK